MIHLCTAGLHFRLEGRSPALAAALEAMAADWPAGDSARARVRIDVTLAAGPAPRDEECEGDPGAGPWRRSVPRLWTARGDGLRHVDARCVEGADGLTGHALRTLLRFLAGEALLRTGGLALHAAAVAAGGGALVALAPSGGGKTTFATRFGRGGVLGDDHVLIAPSRSGLVVVPSPFPGREGTPVTARRLPLWRVVELVQAPRTRRVSLPRAEAVAVVLRHALVPTATPDAHRRALDAALRIARDGRVARLELSLDQPPWDVLGCAPSAGAGPHPADPR